MIFDRLLNTDEENHSSLLEFRTSNGKALWTKHFDSIILFPDYIYDNKGNLSFLATLSLGKDSKTGNVLLLDPRNGNIQTTFTLDQTLDIRLPRGICVSNDLRFLIIKQPIQRQSLEPEELIYLIFKREQKNSSHFKNLSTNNIITEDKLP